MCFAIESQHPGSFDAGGKTLLESSMKKFNSHCIYDGVCRRGSTYFAWWHAKGGTATTATTRLHAGHTTRTAVLPPKQASQSQPISANLSQSQHLRVFNIAPKPGFEMCLCFAPCTDRCWVE